MEIEVGPAIIQSMIVTLPSTHIGKEKGKPNRCIPIESAVGNGADLQAIIKDPGMCCRTVAVGFLKWRGLRS